MLSTTIENDIKPDCLVRSMLHSIISGSNKFGKRRLSSAYSKLYYSIGLKILDKLKEGEVSPPTPRLNYEFYMDYNQVDWNYSRFEELKFIFENLCPVRGVYVSSYLESIWEDEIAVLITVIKLLSDSLRKQSPNTNSELDTSIVSQNHLENRAQKEDQKTAKKIKIAKWSDLLICPILPKNEKRRDEKDPIGNPKFGLLVHYRKNGNWKDCDNFEKSQKILYSERTKKLTKLGTFIKEILGGFENEDYSTHIIPLLSTQDTKYRSKKLKEFLLNFFDLPDKKQIFKNGKSLIQFSCHPIGKIKYRAVTQKLKSED